MVTIVAGDAAEVSNVVPFALAAPKENQSMKTYTTDMRYGKV